MELQDTMDIVDIEDTIVTAQVSIIDGRLGHWMEFRGDVLSLAAPGDRRWCSRGHGGTLLLSSWATN